MYYTLDRLILIIQTRITPNFKYTYALLSMYLINNSYIALIIQLLKKQDR